MRVPSPSLTHSIVVAALLINGTACSKGMSGDESMSVTQTPSGAIVTETYSTTATVTAIDAAKRKLTLQTPDGKKTTFKADPQMVNFPQIQVGDQVNAVVTEEVAIAVWRGGQAPPDAAAGAVALSPVGDKPSGLMVATVMMTAQITALDATKRKVTLQFQDGSSKTIKVDKSVNLSQVAVGDNVTMQVTEAAALTVTKQ
jgi:translation elongation factor P/translation initiation factor 5A